MLVLSLTLKLIIIVGRRVIVSGSILEVAKGGKEGAFLSLGIFSPPRFVLAKGVLMLVLALDVILLVLELGVVG